MKKIIFGLALVLSFGLLASCSQTYNVNDTESTSYSYICEAAGSVTYTATATPKTGKAQTVSCTYTVKGAPVTEVFGYTEYENRNYVTYNFGNLTVDSWSLKLDEITITPTDKDDEYMIGGEKLKEADIPSIIMNYINNVKRQTVVEVNSVYAYGEGTYVEANGIDQAVTMEEDGDVVTLSGTFVTSDDEGDDPRTVVTTTYNLTYTKL